MFAIIILSLLLNSMVVRGEATGSFLGSDPY